MNLDFLKPKETKKNPDCFLKIQPQMVSNAFLKSKEDLKNLKLKENEVFNYISEGRFSMHDLIKHFAILNGCSNLYLSSWTVSAKAVSTLYQLKKKGFLNEIYALVDERITKRADKAYSFLNEFATVRMVANHSKISLFEPVLSPLGEISKESVKISAEAESTEPLYLSIVSSQNLSTNSTIEAGTVFSFPETFEFYKRVIAPPLPQW